MLETFACQAAPPRPPFPPNGHVLTLLRAAEQLAAALATEAGANPTQVRVGDIVQLRPDADAAWGGMLVRITEAGWRLRGYLLVPHRGGCREAWVRLKPCGVVRLGALEFPEATWGFRHGLARTR